MVLLELLYSIWLLLEVFYKNSDIQYKKVSLVRDDNGYIIGIGNKEKDIYLVNGVNTYHILNGEGLHQKMLRFNKHLY